MSAATSPAHAPARDVSTVTARYLELLTGLVNSVCPTWAGGRRRDASALGAAAMWAAAQLSSEHAADIGNDTDAPAQLEHLAHELHGLFTAPSPVEAIDRLNAALATRPMHAQVVDDVGQPYHLHVRAAGGSPVDHLAAEFLITLARVVDRFGEPRTRTCSATRCELVFVDTTKNGSRRYCSDRCAARTKMAAARSARGRAQAGA